MVIGITGAEGLVDWHMRCFLKGLPGISVKTAGRGTFQSQEAMGAFVQGCDAIVHLAGLNRGDDQVLYDTNMNLTQGLVNACEVADVRPHIVFSSSTHVERDTAYGRSKRDCAALLGEWSARQGAAFTELILPHVFGEGGVPFYNSAVSTFCHQIAHGEVPVVNGEGRLEPVHAQTVAQRILGILQQREEGRIRLEGHPISVRDLYERLLGLANDYAGQILPDLRDPFDLDLFNTYRSYLFPASYPVPLKRHTDSRGSLVETVKSRQGGQTFISDTWPGITRGNHYHLRKVERFLVLSGEAVIRLRRLGSTEVLSFPVSGREPSFIDMPTMHTHSITNTGSGPVLTLFWSNEIFDPASPDTYPDPVILNA